MQIIKNLKSYTKKHHFSTFLPKMAKKLCFSTLRLHFHLFFAKYEYIDLSGNFVFYEIFCGSIFFLNFYKRVANPKSFEIVQSCKANYLLSVKIQLYQPVEHKICTQKTSCWFPPSYS